MKTNGMFFATGRVAALVAAVALFSVPVAAGDGRTEHATFAVGCFWCIEADLEKVEGVLSVTSGYTGGSVTNPTYTQVTSGTTGHTEAVRIVFDPTIISYEELLVVFGDQEEVRLSLDQEGTEVDAVDGPVVNVTHDDGDLTQLRNLELDVLEQLLGPRGRGRINNRRIVRGDLGRAGVGGAAGGEQGDRQQGGPRDGMECATSCGHGIGLVRCGAGIEETRPR